MASMQIEVAQSSSPFNYSLKDHNHSTNVKGYIHPQCIRMNKNNGNQDEDPSWLPSRNPKIDDSWLSTNSTTTSKSKGLDHWKGKNDVDDSWLPTVNDTSVKYKTNTNESDNDFDYSWLPSTFNDNKKNKKKHDNATHNTKNKNTNKNNNNNNNDSNTNINNNNNSIMHKRSRNNHWALAREVVFSCDNRIQNPEILEKPAADYSQLKQQDSLLETRYVVESPTSGGVSSLLQRWKDLAETKNSNKNGNNSPSSNRKNSGSTNKENKSDNSLQSFKESDANESDHASRSRRLSCPLPSRDIKDTNPGGTEKEKIRVVDIIKKLSREEELAASHVGGHGSASLPPVRTTLQRKKVEGDHDKSIKDVKVSRHLIRGRQAFNNFLMQMEHDRHNELKWLVERKPVSKFSQRGRIQALLRFKILRLGAEPKPEAKSHRRCVSKTLELDNRLDIMDLRERFNSEVKKEANESRKHKRNGIQKTPNEETLATPTATTREVDVKIKTKTTIDDKKQDPQPTTEPMNPNKSTQYLKTSCKEVQKSNFVDSSSNSGITPKEDKRYKDYDKYDFHEDEGQFMSAKTSYIHMEDKGISDTEENNYTNKKEVAESFHDWMTSEYSQTRSDLDEEESFDVQLFDTNYDWISDISRPKSDWESMRQARYQEMSIGNGDIQRLLERKRVSSFLGSSLRNVIDQLMVSRIQQSDVHVEKQEMLVRDKGGLRKEEVEHEDGSMIDEDGDCRSITETKCSEYSECVDQTPYLERSWKPNDVYNCETTATTSPSLELSLSSDRSHNNSTPQSSPANTHQTIDMELIYDLRGHMEQLHQEIMELRKSIKSCVNMQVKMQHSLQQNIISNNASRSVQKKERSPPNIMKQDCSICNDMQVNSLLYRCGHMCTCFSCALELQRSCGECPVCKAPIVDVVKASIHEN